MEGELWKQLYQWVREIASRRKPQKYVQFPDWWILLVYFWAVVHDRPQGWACDPCNWPADLLAGRPLPSQSRLSERLRTVPVQQLLECVMSLARDRMPNQLVKCIDAKPLPVGSFSKDRDAKRGRAGKAQAKGYKLFAIYEGAGINAWRLGPMNQSESTVARQLIREAATFGEGYLLGDALYDSNPLHALATEHGLQLVAPRKRTGGGLGHRPHEPSRLRAVDMLEGPDAFGRSLYATRVSIEQRFGQAGNLGCGLSPLPNWVRRPHRVALWVATKLLILTCWNYRKQKVTA